MKGGHHVGLVTIKYQVQHQNYYIKKEKVSNEVHEVHQIKAITHYPK